MQTPDQSTQDQSTLNMQKELARRRAMTAQSALGKGQRAGKGSTPIPKKNRFGNGKKILLALGGTGILTGLGLWFS